MFKGRKLVVATKHRKEAVIANVIEQALGVECFAPVDFDTDVLGTFSGEIERTADPVTTARKKCLMAMELTNCDLAIASEGSFGAHPYLFFGHADDELLVFLDKKNDLEIVVRELSTETNFYGAEIKTEAELTDFAEKALFPSHGIILRKAEKDNTEIIKGITEWQQLKEAFEQLLHKYGTAYAETDMRAMYNPTRMAVIGKAAQKLAAKINSCCPQCNTPGFGITDAKPGLPCEWCGSGTRSVLSYVYTCAKCSFVKEEMYPNDKTTEDPMYCDRCNP